jgi:CTP:molybdopterin cytidylyltransferase MocA
MEVSVERARPVTSLVPAPRRLDWPSVGVVLVTGDRPQLLRRALDASAQDYPGSMRLVVVSTASRRTGASPAVASGRYLY